MRPYHTVLTALLASAACALSTHAQQNYFVDLGGTVGVTGTTIIDSPLGAGSGTYQYSAAAPVAGTTWNILPRIAASALSPGQTGNPNTNSPSGDYSLLASPIGLVDSVGGASSVTLNMVSHYAGTLAAGGASTRESIQFNANAGATPGTLMGNNWRDQNHGASGASTTWEFMFSGLTPNLSYSLYFYGSGNAASQGVTGTLGAANGGATGVTTGIATPTSIFDPSLSAIVSQGIGWNVLNGFADGSGNLSFIASRSPGGQFFMNGIQVVSAVPEPAAGTILGLGIILAVNRFRKRA